MRIHSRLLALLALKAIVSSAQAPPAEPSRLGTPWTGAPGVSATTAQLVAREQLGAGQPRTYHVKPLRLMPGAAAAQNSATPAGSGASTQVALTPQTLGVNFTGATLADTASFPPDGMGAAGPAQFIVAVNGRIRSFTKSTGLADGILNVDTDVFFSSVMTPSSSGNFSSDPRIRYDRLSGRWFITMIDVPGLRAQQPNRVMLAVSDSGTITSSSVWTFFQFEQDTVSPAGDTGDFADYPTLGIDANALYIGVNIFNSNGSFANTTVFVVRKSSVLAGGPIVVTAFRGLITGHGPVNRSGPFTPQGVDNYDPAATEGYFIAVDIGSPTTLQLLRVSNPGGTPSISGNISLGVAQFSNPILVPHLGNTGGNNGQLEGLDRRLLAAHLRNGQLWTSHNIAVDNTGSATGSATRDAVRWYQLTGIPTGQTPSVAQFGTVFQASPANTTDQRSFWMGSVMVSGQGHAAFGFSAAGATNFIDAATVGRLAGDAAGTVRTPALYTSSTATYNPPGDTGGTSGRRWGDYSYTCLDPSDDMTMWTIQEFCNATNSYAVQVVKLLAPPPALPTNCTPSVVTQSTANVSLVIQGSPANGAGFFEPGTNFPNHLTATVNGGGVTINSITYNSPASLTANVTVAGNALTGARTVTITNPDGQSATSASALLTIVPGTNQPPVLAAISNKTNAVGMTLTFTNVASDTDGDTLTFSLGAGAAANASLNPTTGVFTWTPTQAQLGSNAFSVIVTDNGSPALSATQSFAVTVVPSNSPPALAAISNRTIAVGMTLTFTNVASDTDGDQLTFSLGAGAAAGATINPTTGVFNWAPTQAQLGSNAFSVIVADNGFPPLSATQSFAVTVLPSNSPPVLAAISNKTNAVGMTLTFTNVASDTDGDKLTFSLGAGAATNATINPTNGVLTWTPVQAQLGSNAFSVIVTDNGLPPLSATQSFAVLVVPSNSPPVLDAISNRTIAVGMTLTLTNVASDTDGDQLTFSLGAGAAAGATINPTNGVFTWAPTQLQLGSNGFSVIVTDNGLPPLSATQSFAVTVLPSNSPPVLDAISNQTVAVGMTLTFTNVASDPDGDLLTFSLGAGAAAGATISPTTGVFTWTPAQAQLGSNGFSVIVTDNGLPPLGVTQSFAVMVVPSNNPPVLAPIPNQTIHALMTLVLTNSATDPDPGEVLTFSLDLGAPPGSSIGATNGVFVWTPADTQTGTNIITVRVTDNGLPNLSDAQTFTVTVRPRPTETISVSNDVVTLTWDAIAGITYRVQFKTNLTDAVWTDLVPDVLATGPTANATDLVRTNSPSFYRLFVPQ